MSIPSTDDSSPDPTVLVLQEALSFQQRQLDQFNAVVLQQQAEINRLRREVNTLTGLVRGALERGGEDLPHEKPPHY